MDALTPEKFIDGMRKLWESRLPDPPVVVCNKKALPVVKALLSDWPILIDPTHDDDCISVINVSRRRVVGMITRLDVLDN